MCIKEIHGECDINMWEGSCQTFTHKEQSDKLL